MIPAISALATFIEEYAIVRRGLKIYRAMNYTKGTLDQLKSALDATSSEEDLVRTPDEWDSLYFYVFTGCLFSTISFDTRKKPFTYKELWSVVDESISSQRFRDSPPDTANKFSAFLNSLARNLAVAMPQAQELLASAVIRQLDTASPLEITMLGIEDSEMITELMTHTSYLEVPSNEVQAVIDIFRTGREVKSLNRIINEQQSNIINLADTPVNLIYNIIASYYATATPIEIGSPPRPGYDNNTISLTTSYIPVAKPAPQVQLIPKLQLNSLTTADLDAAKNEIMANRNYYYDKDSKEFVKNQDHLLQVITHKLTNSNDSPTDDVTVSKRYSGNRLIAAINNSKIKELVSKSKPRGLSGRGKAKPKKGK